MKTELIKKTLLDAQDYLDRFLNDSSNLVSISQAQDLLIEALSNKDKVYSCGNGGSMCDASHFAEELTGRFIKDRPSLPAQAISDGGHISCVANDYGYDHVFSRYIEAFGRKGDVLLAISTSGNSKNVINATNKAQDAGMKVIGLLGKNGGKLKDLVNIPIIIQGQETARIQEIHIKIIHILIEGIERSLYPELYSE